MPAGKHDGQTPWISGSPVKHSKVIVPRSKANSPATHGQATGPTETKSRCTCADIEPQRKNRFLENIKNFRENRISEDAETPFTS